MMGPKDETNPLKRTKAPREGAASKPLCFRTVCVFAADSSKVEQRRESWQGARGQGFAGRVNVGHSTTASSKPGRGHSTAQRTALPALLPWITRDLHSQKQTNQA